jgi:hypothetical protein
LLNVGVIGIRLEREDQFVLTEHAGMTLIDVMLLLIPGERDCAIVAQEAEGTNFLHALNIRKPGNRVARTR